MILNNYWKANKIVEDLIWSNGRKDYGLIGVSGTGIGAIWYARNGNTSQYNLPFYNVQLRTTNIAVRLGTGTGDITADDYSLFNDCTSNITNLAITNNTQAEDNKFSQILLITGINNSGNELTIKEVGICKKFYTNEDYLSEDVMLAKMLLSNPVTIAAGGSFRIIVEWAEQ